MVQVIPTILVKSFEEFKRTVQRVENHFAIAQIDVMDGKFVPNTTFAEFKKIANIKTPLKYELHLMVEEPMDYIEKPTAANLSGNTFPLCKRKSAGKIFFSAKSPVTPKIVYTVGYCGFLVFIKASYFVLSRLPYTETY